MDEERYALPQFTKENQELFTWRCLHRDFWQKNDDDLRTPYVSAGDHILSVPVGPEWENRPDKACCFRMNECSDKEFTAYIKKMIAEEPERFKNITQVDIFGASHLKGQGWFELLDLPLVAFRASFWDVHGSDMIQFLNAPFWKYGQLQFLDLDHSCFLEGDPEYDGRAFVADDKKPDNSPDTEAITKKNEYIKNNVTSLKYLDLKCSWLHNLTFIDFLKSPIIKNLVDLNLECQMNLDVNTNYFSGVTTQTMPFLKQLNLNQNEYAGDDVFVSVMSAFGENLEDFRFAANDKFKCDTDLFLRVQNVKARAFKKLRVLDFSHNSSQSANILTYIKQYCDHQVVEQIHLNSSPNYDGRGIFDNSWTKLKVIDFGNSTEENARCDKMRVHPQFLVDVFFETSIGAKLTSITYYPVLKAEEDDNEEEKKTEAELRVPEHRVLEYLVWYKKELDKLKKSVNSQADAIYQALSLTYEKLPVDIVNDVLELSINEFFYQPQEYEEVPNKFPFYDLDFEDFGDPFSFSQERIQELYALSKLNQDQVYPYVPRPNPYEVPQIEAPAQEIQVD